VSELFEKKAQLLAIMEVLNSNAVAMEEWKASLTSLKTMLEELKAS